MMSKIEIFSKKLGKDITVNCTDKKLAMMGWVKSAWSQDGWKMPNKPADNQVARVKVIVHTTGTKT